MVQKFQKIVVLTGAGISAESGVATFRGPDGLWEGRRVEDVATSQAVAQHPDVVNDFFNKLRRGIGPVQPNPAHKALVELEKAWGRNFLLVTQNIDDLHEKAGALAPLHMHGELLSVLCDFCGVCSRFDKDVTQETPCPHCGQPGSLRPDVVLFGEMPKQMDEIMQALEVCDLFVAIGTSGVVYPAAGFVDCARKAHKIEINTDQTERSPSFNERLTGPAGQIVPAFIAKLLEENKP